MPAAILLRPTGTWTINSVQFSGGGSIPMFTTNTAGVLSGAVTLSTTVSTATLWWMADGWNGIATVSATISGQTILRSVAISANSQSEIELNSGDLDRYLLDSAAGAAGMVGSNNLSEITVPATARTNIGVGTAGAQANSFFCQTGNSLSDVASVSTARTNLGVPATTRQIIAGTRMSGGGDLSADRTLNLVDVDYFAMNNLLLANGDPAGPTGSAIANAGNQYTFRVVAPYSGNVTKLYINVSVAGSGCTAGQCFLGLASASGTILQTSGDMSTQWNGTGNTTGTISSQAVVAGTVYYILVLANAATTLPSFARFTNGGFANINTSGATTRFGINGTGLTTAFASFTPSAASSTTSAWAVAASA